MSLEMVENQHLPNTYLIESYSPNFAPSPDEMFANINEKNKNESFMFLMKHNGQKFGAFAYKNWTKKNEDGICGDQNNFLFSLTRDKRLDAKQHTLVTNKKSIVYQWITEDGLGFGLKDLVLHLDVSQPLII